MSWMSARMDWLQHLPQWLMFLLLGLIMSMLTEVIGKIGAAAIFLPIFGQMVSQMIRAETVLPTKTWF